MDMIVTAAEWVLVTLGVIAAVSVLAAVIFPPRPMTAEETAAYNHAIWVRWRAEVDASVERSQSQRRFL